jgi:hypothetical protein
MRYAPKLSTRSKAQIVSFDTSSHNRLVKDGPLSEPVLAALKSGLSFRFVGLSIDEMVATAGPTKRAALFAYCSRIQDGLSECIYPHDELTKRMVVEQLEDRGCKGEGV